MSAKLLSWTRHEELFFIFGSHSWLWW